MNQECLSDMYVQCTVLYCVRHVCAFVHIRLRKVINGEIFWNYINLVKALFN